MDPSALTNLLLAVRDGTLSTEDALESLRDLPFADLGYAKVDFHRSLRTGFPEVVFCQGKTPEQAAGVVASLAAQHGRVLATRVGPEQVEAIVSAVPDATYHSLPRLITVMRGAQPPSRPASVAVLAAGTADLPVAEEAAITAEMAGCRVQRIYDVGVAGLHRLLSQLKTIQSAAVIVAVAGMEGALPGVVAGLTARPVIAVPTSVGYGTGLGGVAALVSMLNSCSPGLVVTNIDNGFGAGMVAARIISLIGEESWHANA